MSTLDLEPIKERLAAATPGPWDADGTEVSQHWSRPEPWLTIATNEVDCMAYCYGGRGRGVERVEDAEFIAHAPEDIRALLAEVKRLQGELKLLRVMPPAAEQNATLIRLLKEETAALQSEVKRLQAQIDAVKVLHCPDAVQPQYCTECSDFGTDQFPAGELIEWPCPTIQALGGGES